jgi:hypothetical protein
VSDAGERLAEKRKLRLGTVQATRPTAERGRIGHAVWVFERRCGLFPGVVLHKAPPQCLATCQQAVMGVRERKPRQEGEGLPATRAAATADVNPVMMLVVCLLAAASMADDRIVLTNRASSQNGSGTTGGPIGFRLVRRDGKWDKDNRIDWSSATRLLTCQDLRRKRSSFLLKKSQLSGINKIVSYWRSTSDTDHKNRLRSHNS